MTELNIAGGHVVRIDDADHDRVKQHPWWLHNCDGWKYPITHIDGQRVRLSHYLTGITDGLVCYRDNDPLNNQRSNLTTCSRTTAGRKRRKQRKPASSRFKGVYWDKSAERWKAAIVIDGRAVYIGRYDDEDDAGRAYDDAARTHFGEFATLNFPDPR